MCQDSSYYKVTSACINLGSELIFIDACMTPKAAEDFLRAMKQKFNQDKVRVILTHAHMDHFAGLPSFEEYPIIVSANFIESLKSNFQRYQWGKDKREAYLAIELETFSDELVIESENNTLVLRHSGGHSAESIYVYFPNEKVLFAGDNLLSNMPQFFVFEDTDLARWIACLREWEKLDIEAVVVGHGDIVNKDHVTKVRVYFEELLTVLNKSLELELPIETVLTLPDLPMYFEDDPEDWIETGIRQVYQNLQRT
jgi:glyoxylase-like metal-dependent hydrolase (beta-lactamase superfamily II)